LTRDEAAGRFPDEYRDWRTHPSTARRGGGETEDEAGARVAESLKAAAAVWPGRTIAVVSHGLALRGAMRRLGIAGPHLDNGRWLTIQLETRGTLPSAEVLTDAEFDRRSITVADQPETAILAGGCFWGMQDLIRKAPGVISTRVGYTGGDVANATYRNHRGHAEAIEIVFDPDQVSYRDLLEFFFQIHDPTTKNRQGNDIGDSYRSAIFYTTDEQKEIAEETIADVEASGKWPGKVVTQVAAAGPFWEAEPEHQDYLERYPSGYTCHYVRPDWILGSKTPQA
jgi:peptide-methionine (S)-S-oxide reductase